MENLTKEQIEVIEGIFESVYYGEEEGIETIEDKIEALFQYYDSAGFGIKTEQDLFRLLGI